MNKEQYIEAMCRLLDKLDESQLHYIYRYTQGYFDLEEEPEND